MPVLRAEPSLARPLLAATNRPRQSPSGTAKAFRNNPPAATTPSGNPRNQQRFEEVPPAQPHRLWSLKALALNPPTHRMSLRVPCDARRILTPGQNAVRSRFWTKLLPSSDY